MAITTTLSRLKNYFIGWHTANYRTLHEFTDQITEDEPDGSKLVESKTIFRYIKNLLGDKNTPNENTVWGNIGAKCTSRGGNTLWTNICSLWNIIGTECEETTVYIGSATDNKYSKGKTLWNNICHIWGNLGKWGDDNLYNDSYGNPRTIWGWITQFSKKIPILENKTSNLEKEINFRTITRRDDVYSQITFYRTGNVIFVHGALTIRYQKNTTYYNVDFLTGSGELDGGHFFSAFVPKESLYLNFNNIYNNRIYSIQLRADSENAFTFLFTGNTTSIDEKITFSGAYIANNDISNFPSYSGWYSRRASWMADSNWQRYDMEWFGGKMDSVLGDSDNDYAWWNHTNSELAGKYITTYNHWR